jgi:hypothetical protein
MDFRFRPIPQDPNQLHGFLRESFRELQNSLQNINDERKGFFQVSGQSVLTTGLGKCLYAAAGLYDDPVAGACFVSAKPGAAVGSIQIRVFTSAFALSVTPINVWWMAFGF